MDLPQALQTALLHHSKNPLDGQILAHWISDRLDGTGSITKTSLNLTQRFNCLQQAIDTALKWKALRINS